MPVSWAVFRDSIVVDSAFTSELGAELAWRAQMGDPAPPGSTLLIGARSVKFASGFAFSVGPTSSLGHGPYNLLIVADVFDGGTGAVEASGGPGSPGQHGRAGKDSYSLQVSAEAGSTGGEGTPGQAPQV